MKTIKFSCTDAELSAAVTEHVAGEPPKHRYRETSDSDYCVNCGHESWQDDRPCHIPYAVDVNALIPLLSKYKWIAESMGFSGDNPGYKDVVISVWVPGDNVVHKFFVHGDDPQKNFARGACFVLLEVCGVKIS